MMAKDPEIGISVRFIRQFDIVKAETGYREDTFASRVDAALFLAKHDGRDVPMVTKVSDAWAFVHSLEAEA